MSLARGEFLRLFVDKGLYGLKRRALELEEDAGGFRSRTDPRDEYQVGKGQICSHERSGEVGTAKSCGGLFSGFGIPVC